MAEERYKKADFEDLIEESILMTIVNKLIIKTAFIYNRDDKDLDPLYHSLASSGYSVREFPELLISIEPIGR